MLRIGMMVTLEWTAAEDGDRRLDELLEQVRTARDAGFQALWVTQHFVPGAGMRHLQAMPILGRLSGEAPGMTLGTGVLLASMLNPVLLAEESATLDRLTGGKFILGIGIGYRDHEFQSMGVKRSERVARLVEYIAVMRRLWREDAVTHHGRFVHLDEIGIGLRPANPQLWIGGTVPAAVKRAAELGDSWIAAAATHTDELKQLWDLFHDTRVAKGLSLDYPKQVSRECFVGPDMKSAVAMASGPLLAKYGRYAGYGFGGLDTSKPPEEAFPAFAKDRFLIGDSAYVRDELQRYQEVFKPTEFRFRMNWTGLDHQETLASIRRAGKIAASL